MSVLCHLRHRAEAEWAKVVTDYNAVIIISFLQFSLITNLIAKKSTNFLKKKKDSAKGWKKENMFENVFLQINLVLFF